MIKNLLKEGFILEQKGHYKNAIEVFYKALEQDNKSTELLVEIAGLYYKLGNEQKALEYIEQALDENAAQINALKLLKLIFINKKAYAEAEQAAKNIYCISHNTNDLVEILRLLNLQGKYKEVFEYKTNNSSYLVDFERGKSLYYQKEFGKAEELLKKALECEPENQNILLFLGKVLYSQKKYEECAVRIQYLNQEDAEVYNLKGLMAGIKKDYYKAAAYFQNAIKMSPQNSEYYFNLANIYLKQDNNLLAKKYYNFAVSLEPENLNYHFVLANLYYREKHYKKALEELRGDFYEANLLKAIILYDTGYLALAKRELEKLSEENSENSILLDYKNKIDKELGLS